MAPPIFFFFFKLKYIYILINEISQNFRRIFKKVLFWPLHPLFGFRRNSFGLTIFSRKKNSKKMPRSCLKEKKKKKKSLWLTLVLIVEGGCVSQTFFFLHLHKITPLPPVDLQSTISLFSPSPLFVPFVFSFPSLLQLIDTNSKTPRLLYYLLQFQYNKATKKIHMYG